MPGEVFAVAWELNGGCGAVVAKEPIPSVPDSTLPLFAGVGAAAALAALGALGMARKGLGAGRTDEGEGSWADYSWREPPAQPVETWANYASYVPDPPEETWFDSRVYDEGPHEQTAPAPSSSESSQVEMTPDAGVNDASAINTQATQTTEQGWGAKSDAELMAEAEKEAAQRRKEIKTIEDAKKVAEEDANKALEAFMLQSSGTAGIKTVSSGISLVNPEQLSNFNYQPLTDPSGDPDPFEKKAILLASGIWNWYDQNVNRYIYDVVDTWTGIKSNAELVIEKMLGIQRLPSQTTADLIVVGNALATDPNYAKYAPALTPEHLQNVRIQEDTLLARFFIGTVGSMNGSRAEQFTFGQTIYIDRGKYPAATSEGTARFAHEVEHTYQFKKDGILKFASSYIFEFAYQMIITKKYDGISYEIEGSEVEKEVLGLLKYPPTKSP